MSGDVQPRKRKDKRRRKDELGVEEPRGTAAVFGEGDVLMHSHHDHGTGGHWCAKIIFFSLLSVLVTLIVLIILENRGLTELEANAVESRYSGVLDGWIEDAPDDDHHDEHTLDLKHHSYEEILDDDQHDIESEHDEEDDHNEEFNDENEEHASDDEDADDDDEDNDDVDDDAEDDEDDIDDDEKDDIGYQDRDEKNVEEDDEDDEDDERMVYKKYTYEEQAEDNEDDEDHDSHEQVDEDSKEDLKEDTEGNDESNELEDDIDDDEQSYNENDDSENDDKENEDTEDNEEDDDDDDEEVERIEREVVDEEQLIDNQDVENDENDIVTDDDEAKAEENEAEEENVDEDTPDADEDVIEPPLIEQIPVPSGKPFVELEDDQSSEKPTDTLAEEEEYEKRQEQIRLEKEESSSQMWLKLVVGGALLLATHAVIRRSTRDTPDSEDTREETPSLIDRRMTLLPRDSEPLLSREATEPIKEIVETLDSIKKTVQSVPIPTHESEEENEDANELVEEEITPEQTKNVVDKELYSDEEEVEENEEIVEEKEDSNEHQPEIEKEADDSEAEEVPDDVEIIDDEQIEEEIEDEEEVEEEISDVDDAELLSRLEAKYGRLPEPERPGPRHKDGGNNILDEWPGEPSDPYWRRQLDLAEEDIRQGGLAAARARLSAAEVAGSGRARWLAALAADTEAEQRRDNKLLTRAIAAYLQLLKSSERLSDAKLLQVTTRTLDRIQFRGNYLSAEPVYRILIRRFPNEVSYRNNLTVSFLMANRADLAADVLKETLRLWPNDRVALAHYGFVLKTHFNKLEESVAMFRKALENDTGPACEPRFYYHLGDALLLLGRSDEAHAVHERGAARGHFLSPAQRSLYNVDRLRSRPWWRVEETPYIKLARTLERSWKEILKEGEAARALYEQEKEGLKEKGEWSQLDIYVRGQEIPGRCKRAPVTCSIVKTEPSAANCRRGQIKFSLMQPGTHVRPHVGPTNCRLRMHLGLSNTKDTYIRVDQETRQWQLGKVLLFDDSFEHEVWHNGTGGRLVLIVDVWHPALTAAERRRLPAI